MQIPKKYGWNSLCVIAIFVMSSLCNGRMLQANFPTNTIWNDNFDEILNLFKNQFIHTFHYNTFESLTKGPPKITQYCLQNRKTYLLDIEHGLSQVYCIKSAAALMNVVQIYLPNEGLKIERQEKAYNAGNAVFQKYSFVWICVKRCKDGMKPNITIGNYKTPRPRNSFSVGCQDSLEACEPSCADAIYNVRNGLVNCSQDTLVGSVCQLECKEGYVRVGVDKATCTRDQTWDNARRFKCLPEDVGHVINSLMKNKHLSVDGALKELQQKVERYLGEKSRILPSTRQEPTDDTQPIAIENELIKSVREFIASLKTTQPPKPSDTPSIALKSLGVCEVASEHRIDCGFPGISPDDCDAKGCCWNATEYNTFWCFEKDNTVSPMPSTSERTMKEPPTIDLQVVKPANEVEPLDQQFTQVQLVDSAQPPDRQTLHDVPFPFAQDFLIPQEQKGEDKSCGCVSHQQYVQPLPRVFCGRSIDVNRSPWHAIVHYGTKMCGGTLISLDFVITAAHCLVLRIGEKADPNTDKVYLGVTRRDQVADKSIQVHNIGTIIRHPLFKLSGASNVRYDIALIKLAKTAQHTTSVRPICLPGKRRTAVGTKCQITGFGEKVPQTGKAAIVLQMVSLYIKKSSECNMYQSFDSRQNICAGSGPTSPADACRGDSGGPLACQGKEGGSCSWYLAGITSFGKEPCGSGAPGVYVDVANFYEWIKSHTGL